MKFAKLNFKTKEGLSLAHYSEGYSREWGEGGSYHCDLLYNDKKVAEINNDGNGGQVDLWFTNQAMKEEVDNAVLAFLKRTDENYGPNSKYEFCKNITKAKNDEYEALVEDLINEQYNRKDAAKMLDKGWDCVGVFDHGSEAIIFGGIGEKQIRERAAKEGVENYPARFYYRSVKPNKIVIDF